MISCRPFWANCHRTNSLARRWGKTNRWTNFICCCSILTISGVQVFSSVFAFLLSSSTQATPQGCSFSTNFYPDCGTNYSQEWQCWMTTYFIVWSPKGSGTIGKCQNWQLIGISWSSCLFRLFLPWCAPTFWRKWSHHPSRLLETAT